MSNWTHVTGTIHVDTCARSDAEAMYLIQTVIQNLPRVTGSERDLQFHVNVPEGSTSSSNTDEFGRDSNLYNDPHGGPWFDVHTGAIITIHGDLRDRYLPETLRELTAMLNRLSTRLWVDRSLISVKDGKSSFIFDDPAWLQQNASAEYMQLLMRPDSPRLRLGPKRHTPKDKEAA